jgi:hypothetical protein
VNTYELEANSKFSDNPYSTRTYKLQKEKMKTYENMLNRQGKESKVDSPFKLQETDFSGFVLSLLRLKVLMTKSLHFLVLNVQSSKMEPVEIMFIRKAFINERGAEKTFAHPPSCESSLKIPRYWQFGNELKKRK